MNVTSKAITKPNDSDKYLVKDLYDSLVARKINFPKYLEDNQITLSQAAQAVQKDISESLPPLKVEEWIENPWLAKTARPVHQILLNNILK